MQKSEEMKYWSLPFDAVLQGLHSTPNGLAQEEASSRLKEYGENSIKTQGKTAPLLLFLRQFKNPIIIIMVVATVISAATGSWIDSLIILMIVLGSLILSFLQEYSASNAVEALRSKVQIKSTVLRNGQPMGISSKAVVPGDIVTLSAGSIIPADGLILECDDFNVNQSIFTGESLPADKKAGEVSEDADLAERKNCVLMGTNVHSGSATVLVVRTGSGTEFGQIAEQLTRRPPETEFERGVRKFGYLLTKIILILALCVLVMNVIFKRPFIDSLLFSVALAVGITPQLLPAIINITLAKGARTMAKKGVIVRRLTAIINFGSMDVLCTDKTGTLTEGELRLDSVLDFDGQPSDAVFRLAYLNSSLQIGMANSMDAAIKAYKDLDISAVKKLDENPFDFSRKRLGIFVQEGNECSLIVKGALNKILEVCDRVQINTAAQAIDTAILESINQRFLDWSNQGFRVLGIAAKPIVKNNQYGFEDEQAMIFMGFLLFFDPPKADVSQTIADLDKNGVQLRMITGDNKLIALHTANAIGMKTGNVMTGAELSKISDELFTNAIENVNIFSEVDPSQKERIILALKKNNHVVGYMGDGINDAPALHAADVSISVNTAVDVAKEAADFVLLEKSLDILRHGIELGRTTFSNTLKYISITTSANFGNVFSMAGASLFMPFLPLLPKQILLINFITDLPAMTIANDTVDAELVVKPRRWDIRFIRNFMLTFGLISSAFDYLTFAVLLIGFKAQQELFQSSWFMFSILTELLTLVVIRTRKPFFKSKPAPLLLFTTIGVGILTVLLPFLPLQKVLGISPIPLLMFVTLIGIAVLYTITIEVAKYFFYRSKSNL